MKDGFLCVAGEEITPTVYNNNYKLFLSKNVLTLVVIFHVRVAGACFHSSN